MTTILERISDKRKCEKCHKIKILPEFRIIEGEYYGPSSMYHSSMYYSRYDICIKCEYEKRRKRAPEEYQHDPKKGYNKKCLTCQYHSRRAWAGCYGEDLNKICITCGRAMNVERFYFEEGVSASIPLDPLDVEYIHKYLDSYTLDLKRNIMATEKVEERYKAFIKKVS